MSDNDDDPGGPDDDPGGASDDPAGPGGEGGRDGEESGSEVEGTESPGDGPADPSAEPPGPAPGDPASIDDLPRISCSRCDREWSLEYELDTLQVGNQAVEQFALDHRRHTGHFPDDVSTWRATCRQCPEEIARLEERSTRRWASTHARHTGHDVAIRHASLDGPELVEDKSE